MRLNTSAVTALLFGRSTLGFLTSSSHSGSCSFLKSSSVASTAAMSTRSSRLFSVNEASSSSSSSSSCRDALISCPTISLRDGTLHPAIGFGTYKVGFIPASASSAVVDTGGGEGGAATDAGVERTASECVLDALDCGYRFLECAEFYGNEAEIGKAIQASKLPRDQLFLCSKVWTTTIEKGPHAIRAQLQKTLTDLGTDYLDLYLIHWPVPNKHVQAYKTLELLQKEGKIKGIGVSNYALEDYLELKHNGVQLLPLVNQIEINPFLYRKNTIDAFQKDGVVLQSYRSLRDGKAMDHPTLQELAQRYDKSVAQILGRWCVQKGFVYMPKSVQKDRMVQNGRVFDFVLTEEDMDTLDALTTPENIQNFVQLYRKCVNRDTTQDGTMEGVKMEITED